MNSIQIADETFVAADPVEVGRAVGDRASWRRWWPDLLLTVVENREDKGHRWTVAGALTGAMEIWLEPVLDGVVLHYFLHAEPSGGAGWERGKMNLAKVYPRRAGCGGLAAGQDEPGEAEPSPPSGGQEHGVRGEADTGGDAPSGRIAPGLILRPEPAAGG